jgi:hypothetical protein
MVIENTIFEENMNNNNNNLEIEYNITFIKEKLNNDDDINLAFNSIKQELEFSIVSLKFEQLLHQYGIPVEVTTGNIKFISETVVILRSTLLPTSIPTIITVKKENSNKSNRNKTNLTPLYVFIALLGFIIFISFLIIYYYYETYEHKRLMKIYLNSTYEKTVENNIDNITAITAATTIDHTELNKDDIHDYLNKKRNNNHNEHNIDTTITINNHDNDNDDNNNNVNHNNNTDRSYMSVVKYRWKRIIETIFPAVVLKANDEVLIETTQLLSPLTYDDNPTSATNTATTTTSIFDATTTTTTTTIFDTTTTTTTPATTTIVADRSCYSITWN